MTLLRFRRSPETPEPVAAAAPAADSSTDDAARALRFGAWALGIAFLAFIAWAAMAPLDEGVVAPATVALDTHRKTVQHLTGGIVREVLVHEGQQVEAAQPLLRLDAAAARAAFEASRQRYLGLRANESRLRAEQSGAVAIRWPAELVQGGGDPQVRQQLEDQQQLMAARRASLAADLQAIEAAIRGQEAQIASWRAMAGHRRQQLASLQEELAGLRDLVRDGYAPRNRQLELERTVADTAAAGADLEGNVLRAQQSIAEQRQRAIGRQQEYRRDVEQQLADTSRDAAAEGEKYRALQDELGRTEVRAPVGGQVVGLAVQTVGAVVQPGEKLMDVVPGHEPLLLEAHVPPQFVDRVKSGLPVDIRFAGFAHSPQLVVQGQVASVSGDLLADAQNASAPPFYLARVAVTPEGLRRLGARQLQPGMPAEVVIRTGERSLLAYLLHPLTRRVAGAMKEE